MNDAYDALLERVIEDGIVAARADYSKDIQSLAGATAGFEACRGKTPEQLAVLLGDVQRETREARIRTRVLDAQSDDYWYWRCRELEVEWVCNVVSAVLMNHDLPVIVPPTCRGVMKAAEIVGVGTGDATASPDGGDCAREAVGFDPAAASRDDRRVVPYAIGICAASVCAVTDAEADEVARALNALQPTGISSPWEVADDKEFSSGEPNPCPCNVEPDARRHWLLIC